MPVGRMHENEVETDADLVRRLLAAQFPQWADLPIARVASAGTDNALYRLGDELVARLPRIDWAAGDVEKEQRSLPRLAPHLPLPIPVPLAMGKPDEGYPWSWSVYRWLEGEDATKMLHVDQEQVARDLADFILALWEIDSKGGPLAGLAGSSRGVPLATRDAETRAAIASLDHVIDARAATALWDEAFAAPVWGGAPVWVHGDLSPLNLLVQNGRISAVIDFGAVAVGDPAVDLLIAWNYFSGESREIYRAALGVDEATWMRGRGWALSTGVGFHYYEVTNSVLAGLGRRAITEVLADYMHAG